ncbi:class I SAM-dependent DNA methyltransferase [Chryseobacterium sp. 5_R23647]|uniref:class I SAM-dependent DNA methyltransferase n=1 Tax=Chryseobacterium sp. 5_R23647 TaxID=2258964 RepID=UPI000E288B9A|nr:DNA methyltransferase [Chryseobacterium sp. 5_R23647]REC45181.1 class I SAM-dependent DNA methyltransferase [Chryseobacterium sp. 5_R23647]
MKKTEIQDKLKYIAQNIDGENFIYDFLLSFGLSKTTITRLKKGDYNLSKKEGELFYKGKIFFKIEKSEDLLHTIDEISKDEKIARQKPRFLFVTDFEKGVAIDTKKSLNKVFDLKDLGELEQVDFFLPLSGAEIYRVSNNNKADRDAAYKLGELYDLLVKENPEWVEKGSHHLNLFLSRLLFCFFAEDTGIFETKNIFTEAMVNNTKADGSDMHEFLDALFTKLDSNPSQKITFPDYLSGFPYVNGGLFRDTIECPKFSKKARQMLIDAGELEWADINPDIFGSMIQAVADPEERNNLGMHYTSVINILKLIKPLFLDELYEEFEKNKDNARELNKLLVRISKIKFFDPACGSGNFLIITYKELRNLEIQIIKQLLDLGENRLFFTEISLTQFYGIEIKDFAHEMAILSLWLAEHQMNQVFETELLDFGQSKPILPLKEAGNIVAGNAARMDWENVCQKNDGDEIYIIGNPPYLGSNMHSDEQRLEMQTVFNAENLDRLDYIGTWFMLGASYIQNTKSKCAFVTTNSITQGVQVPFLWNKIFEKDIFIQFAVKSFKWTNNAKGNAGVSVVIIGLSSTKTDGIYLYENNIAEKVISISPYLIKNTNIIVKPASQPQKGLPSLVMGNKPADDGNLILDKDEMEKLIEKFPSSKKFIKKFISADDYLNGKIRYCLWIESSDAEEAKLIPAIKERTEKLLKFRSESKAKSTRDFAVNNYSFRQISYKPTDGIVVPRVSSEKRDYIPMAYINDNFIVSDATNIIYDAEPWLFGVLHSKMHMVWVGAVGGKLKTDYRYSAKLCYNTFPFPTLNEKQKESITQYVFSVLDERAKFPEKTMAWLYNPETMPSGLKQAHHELDLAIERIYRLAPFNSDEERLAYLFKLYEEMTNRESLFAKEKKKRGKK